MYTYIYICTYIVICCFTQQYFNLVLADSIMDRAKLSDYNPINYFLIPYRNLPIDNRRQMSRSRQLKQPTLSRFYSDLCNSPNKYKISDIANFKHTKSSSMFNLSLAKNTKNQHQMNVISPFYDKNKCNLKGNCKCPYHRLKKPMIISLHSKKEGLKKINVIDNLRKYRKINTEMALNQNNIAHNPTIVLQKNDKQLPNTEKQNYYNISHKVQCRNSEFQQFLKRNQLYILTGKFTPFQHKTKETEQEKENQIFMENFIKYFQQENDQSFQCFYRSMKKHRTIANGLYSREILRKQSRKKTQKMPNKFTKEGIIRRIRQLVELLINGTKQMSLKKMKKLKVVFQNLVLQERELCGQSSQNLKNQACLSNFQTFLTEFIKKGGNLNQFPNNSSSKCSPKIAIHKKGDEQFYKNSKKINENMNQIEGQDEEEISNEKQQLELKKEQQLKIIKKEEERQKKLNKYLNSSRRQSANQTNSQSKRESHRRQSNMKNTKKSANKYIKKMYSQLKTIHGFSNYRDSSFDKRSRDFQKSQRDESNDELNILNHQSLFHQRNRNEKQAKLQQIFSNLKQDQMVDKNYLKMKKYIERNKKFIKKMQMKLLNLNLGVFVIQPTDSLITRKKKIRCLRQIIQNNESEGEKNKGFYDQIMKYLDIYTEHCNMVMKKNIKKKTDQQPNFVYEQLEQEQFLKSKDFTGSLKFINLYQNLQFQKQKKLEGWISIPQYITNDETRLKYKKFQETLKKIGEDYKQKPKEDSLQSQDSLVQINLDNICKVKNQSSEYYTNNQQRQKFRKDKKKTKISIMSQTLQHLKIQYFKKKLARICLVESK